MLESYFVDAVTLYQPQNNDWGDKSPSGAGVDQNCRLREIDALDDAAVRDDYTSTGLAHFPPTATVVNGTIFKHKATGNFYRVIGVTRAKRLGETTVQFLKCQIQRNQAVA